MLTGLFHNTAVQYLGWKMFSFRPVCSVFISARAPRHFQFVMYISTVCISWAPSQRPGASNEVSGLLFPSVFQVPD